MSSDRTARLTRRAALAGLVLLAGCGFTPVYAPGGVGDALQDKIAVTAPDTVPGYALRQRLVDRLGRAAAPVYELEIALDIRRDAATITTDGDTTRFDVVGTAAWVLTEVQSGSAIAGQAQSFTSYATTGSTVATQTARADAEDRLAVILADLIVTQLITQTAQP